MSHGSKIKRRIEDPDLRHRARRAARHRRNTRRDRNDRREMLAGSSGRFSRIDE